MNDRPYAASCFLSVALNKAFSQTLSRFAAGASRDGAGFVVPERSRTAAARNCVATDTERKEKHSCRIDQGSGTALDGRVRAREPSRNGAPGT